ncbi:hypothetical protein Chor_014899 [Crotalus horridus]
MRRSSWSAEGLRGTEGSPGAVATGEDPTSVAIASIQSAATFPDPNIKYVFRAENGGAQLMYRVIQVAEGQLDGQTEGSGAISGYPATQSMTQVGHLEERKMGPPEKEKAALAVFRHDVTPGSAPEWDPAVDRAPDSPLFPLSKIIPDCSMENTKSAQSKGGILSKACDYIQELRQNNIRLSEELQGLEQLQVDNEVLRQQVEDLKNKNLILRAQLRQHGVEVIIKESH